MDFHMETCLDNLPYDSTKISCEWIVDLRGEGQEMHTSGIQDIFINME